MSKEVREKPFSPAEKNYQAIEFTLDNEKRVVGLVKGSDEDLGLIFHRDGKETLRFTLTEEAGRATCTLLMEYFKGKGYNVK